MRRLNVRCSTSVLLMVLEALPSTASSAPTEPSSTRTTSSVTGGSTLTVTMLRISTISIMRYFLPKKLLHRYLLRMPLKSNKHFANFSQEQEIVIEHQMILGEEHKILPDTQMKGEMMEEALTMNVKSLICK